MKIAWTTVATRADAERLAAAIVVQRLAACVQVDGPIASFYLWKGKTERTEEFRLLVKILPSQATALAAWIEAHHPYDTPEWVVVDADAVAEKYLSWAQANSSTPPL